MIDKFAARLEGSAFRTFLAIGITAALLPLDSFAASEPLRPLTAAEIKAGPQKKAINQGRVFAIT